MLKTMSRAPQNRVINDENLHAIVESYLDLPSLLSWSETRKHLSFFSQPTSGEMKKNQYWKQRYELYFGEIAGIHKCYEQRFRDQYEHTVNQIKHNPASFSMIGDLLRADRYLALIAVKGNRHNITHVGDALLKDISFMLEAITMDPCVYFYRTGKLIGSRCLAIAFVNENPSAYGYIPDELKEDPEIIHIVASALGYANEDNERVFTNVAELDELAEPIAPPTLRRDQHYVAIEHDITYENIAFRRG